MQKYQKGKKKTPKTLKKTLCIHTQRGMIPIVLQDLNASISLHIIVYESSIINSTFNTHGKPSEFSLDWIKKYFHLTSQSMNSVFLCRSICFLTSLRNKKPDTTAPLKYSLCTCCDYAPPHTICRTIHAHRVMHVSKDLGDLVKP